MSVTISKSELARPPFDLEVGALLATVGEQLPPTLTPDMIEPMRQGAAIPIADQLAGRGITHEERRIPGPDGAPDILISILQRDDHVTGGPGIYSIHGGGMIVGDRFTGLENLLGWIEETDAVAISLEYRLAPEDPDPAAVNDCYAGLAWMAGHADELGFDPDRLIVTGGSAGGGLAAGVTLLARDNGGPAIAGQLLVYPMLDDRNQTVSSHQYVGIGVWDRGSNDTGWDAYLGDRRYTDEVSIYAAPSRATDLSGLPPTFIDVGSAEVFRDENVAFASSIWASGGICELHVYAGGYHGSDMFVPQAGISVAARANRSRWLKSILG